MEIKIVKLSRTDLDLFKQLLNVFNEVFKEEGVETTALPDDNYLTRLLSQTSFHVFTALNGDEVVGGLTGYELTMYLRDEKEMYLYDLGVSDKFRRLGVASKLIDELKKFGKSNNISTIFVEANIEDEGAVKFYQSLGAEMEDVKHFNLKP